MSEPLKMHAGLFSSAICLALVLLPTGSAPAAEAVQPEHEPTMLGCKYEQTATVFDLWEMTLTLPEGLKVIGSLPDTQIHDAYDADRNNQYVRLWAELRHADGTIVTVPAFAMREKPGGPWQWKVRWSPRRGGEWSVEVRFSGRAGESGVETNVGLRAESKVIARAAPGITGPLVRPGKGQPPGYLRRLRADGTSEGVWLFGACRAWVVKSQDPNNDWYPHEWLDRETELFAPMRDGGFNLLNQWMAPWEFLIVHHDRAEFWRKPEGDWKRVPLPKEGDWTSYQCYDQGRALAFDNLLRQAEGDTKKATVHLLLSSLPHQCLQLKEHPWGGQESGWSPENDAGRQTPERLNGLSGFKKDMSVWDFFEADPSGARGDWRSRLFDHQANFFRYVIARWGYSRALGVWVLVDELDAVGEEVGVMSAKKGWWAHPECDRWLADIVRMFRGELTGQDGAKYQGDPFGHPLHAATTSYGGGAGKGSNLEWRGGPEGVGPDLFGWHWYPYWGKAMPWADIWEFTIDGVARYASAPIGRQARLISEFGVPDRGKSKDPPSPLLPSIYHFAAWAGIFSGQAGTPMDWDDGKQFGELKWRSREGIFHKSVYPIDHVEQIKALRTFLSAVTPDDVVHDAAQRCEADRGMRAFALFTREKDPAVLGWLFSRVVKGRFRVTGLKPGSYRISWYDPWTGKALAGEKPVSAAADKKGVLEVDPEQVFKRIREKLQPFPGKTRFSQGCDLAFEIAAEGK